MARYNVIATHDAVAALAMVRTQEPVAVILDVQMPGGDGLSAHGQAVGDDADRRAQSRNRDGSDDRRRQRLHGQVVQSRHLAGTLVAPGEI